MEKKLELAQVSLIPAVSKYYLITPSWLSGRCQRLFLMGYVGCKVQSGNKWPAEPDVKLVFINLEAMKSGGEVNRGTPSHSLVSIHHSATLCIPVWLTLVTTKIGQMTRACKPVSKP